MRYDGADVSSLGAIAFGSIVGVLGTGAMLSRVDESRDALHELVVEVPAPRADPAAAALLRAYPRVRLQPRIRTTLDLRNGPVIFVDGVRIGVTADPGAVFESLDPNTVEHVSVRRGPDEPEIHIELKH